MTISTNAKKVFEKNQHPFVIKKLNKLGDVNLFNLIKCIHEKLIIN